MDRFARPQTQQTRERIAGRLERARQGLLEAEKILVSDEAPGSLTAALDDIETAGRLALADLALDQPAPS